MQITLDQLWEAMTKAERDAMTTSRVLPVKFIKKHWYEMSRYQWKMCVLYQTLTLDFLSEKWEELGGDIQYEAAKRQSLTDQFIYNNWEGTNWFAQVAILQVIKLSPCTVEKCWSLIGDNVTLRQYICDFQDLTTGFIEKHWGGLSQNEKAHCYLYQNLAAEFAATHWSELEPHKRKECVIRYVNTAPRKLLPIFLTDADEELRQKAIKRMEELNRKEAQV